MNNTLKKDIKNHLHYRLWVYIAIAALAFFGADFLYTVTAYHPPAEKKVDIQVIQKYVDTDMLQKRLGDQLLADGQAFDDSLEEVEFFLTTRSGEQAMDTYSTTKISVLVAARDGDVWILPRDLFEQMHAQGLLTPLADLVDRGLIHTDDLDLSDCMLSETPGGIGENGELLPGSGEDVLFALPAYQVSGLSQAGCQDQDSYIILMNYSTNADTAAVVMDSMVQMLKDGIPEEVVQ